MTNRIFISTLGGVKYPEVIKLIPKHIGTKYFWKEFGLAQNQIINDAKSGRQAIAVQGLWAGSSHNYTDAHRRESIEIALHLQSIAAQFPNTQFSYSPFCENKKSSDYMQKLLTEIKAKCPNLRLVNSPIAGGGWVKGFVNEIHPGSKPPGMPPGEYDFDYDGVNCFDAENVKFKKDYSNATNFAYWCYQCNCHFSGKDKDRNTRLTQELVEMMLFIAVNQKLDVKLLDGWIGKSNSEQHKPIDSRANKVVLIGPKGKKQKKVSIGGIALTDGGLTEDKRNTWRSNLKGYKQKRPLKVVVDGVTIGEMDCAYRQNEYRNKV